MEKQRKKRFAVNIVCLLVLLFLAACGQKEDAEENTTGFVAVKGGMFDSADTAVVAAIDREQKSVTLKNMDVKKQYTLSYDGTTYFYDKYGKVISAAQLKEGEIVDVTFLKERKQLNTLQLSKEAWNQKYMNDYRLNEEKFQAQVGNTAYAYSEDTVVIADEKQGELIDLSPVDILTFRGMGSDIYSIVVEKGHGYVRLKNEEYFYDGWIEIGNKVIKKVTENMMLTVPEGSHQVIISNKGTSGVKQITVRRNIEVELDVGDLKGAEPKYGNIIFTITPEKAALYLDGNKTDYSEPVRLEYGIHQMIVMADGYETISRYLKVGSASAGIEVTMEEKKDASSNNVSGNNVSGNNTSGNDVSGQNTLYNNEMLDRVNQILAEKGYSGISAEDLVGNKTNSSVSGGNAAEATGNSSQTPTNQTVTSTLSYYVTVEAPTGVEVYLDGNYIGITPCSFKKTSGSHMITLRKSGYVAKSYTIQVDEEQKNVSYSFLDLAKVE